MSDDEFGDYCYEVWRRGGNPDAVQRDDVPEDYDWVWDEPRREHLPKETQEETP